MAGWVFSTFERQSLRHWGRGKLDAASKVTTIEVQNLVDWEYLKFYRMLLESEEFTPKTWEPYFPPYCVILGNPLKFSLYTPGNKVKIKVVLRGKWKVGCRRSRKFLVVGLGWDLS